MSTGDKLIHHCRKLQSGRKQANLILTSLELIDKIVAFVPSPCAHSHRYIGVLAPQSPLRETIKAMAVDNPAVVLSVVQCQINPTT
jgi:hypothetical protein